jgi:HSP20 family protein
MISKYKEECRRPLTNKYYAEDKSAFIFKIEMPGLRREHIDLSVVGDILEVFGEKKKIDYEKGLGGFVRKEFEGPIYYREFQLPKNVIEDEIEAKMKDGILKIILPIKKVETEKKRIEIH